MKIEIDGKMCEMNTSELKEFLDASRTGNVSVRSSLKGKIGSTKYASERNPWQGFVLNRMSNGKTEFFLDPEQADQDMKEKYPTLFARSLLEQ